MYAQLNKLEFPMANNMFEGSIKGSDYETLLVNAPGHCFNIKSMEDILYPSKVRDKKETQVEEFISRSNNTRQLWRPVACIREYPGSSQFTINLVCDDTYSTLIHTGPFKMLLGDYIYVLPPLQCLTSTHESSPFCYKYARSGQTCVNPMLMGSTDFQAFRDDFYGVHLQPEETKYKPVSKLGKYIGVDSLKELTQIAKYIPIGQIISKYDSYGANSNEIAPGMKFTLAWSGI